MKHCHKQLVSLFKNLESKMDCREEEVEEFSIRELHSIVRDALHICVSDNQIRYAANEVFKMGGYTNGCSVWITEKLFLKEENDRLRQAVERLNDLAYSKSHAARVLRSA
jgi:hypothetical protein